MHNLKKQHRYRCLGLMSGTSFDGLDIALCHFEKQEKGWNFQIEKGQTIPYSDLWHQHILTAKDKSFTELWKLHLDFGHYTGNKVRDFLTHHAISPSEIDFIASHGHTIFHQPEKHFTFQLGYGGTLATASQVKVIADFRTQDVMLGGQGAPLVPIGDELLFGQYDFCLNLGGIANISYNEKGVRKAFDICPVNMILNHLAGKKNLQYDHDGQIAKSGKITEKLLNKLEKLSFYQLRGPKSLGKEWVATHVLPLLEASSIDTKDKLATATHHIALRIADVLHNTSGKVLLSGGGSLNKYLLEQIQKHVPKQVELILPEKKLIDYKEALIFAFLGLLRLSDNNNCLASVTGAEKDHIAGAVYLP